MQIYETYMAMYIQVKAIILPSTLKDQFLSWMDEDWEYSLYMDIQVSEENG